MAAIPSSLANRKAHVRKCRGWRYPKVGPVSQHWVLFPRGLDGLAWPHCDHRHTANSNALLTAIRGPLEEFGGEAIAPRSEECLG